MALEFTDRDARPVFVRSARFWDSAIGDLRFKARKEKGDASCSLVVGSARILALAGCWRNFTSTKIPRFSTADGILLLDFLWRSIFSAADGTLILDFVALYIFSAAADGILLLNF